MRCPHGKDISSPCPTNRVSILGEYIYNYSLSCLLLQRNIFTYSIMLLFKVALFLFFALDFRVRSYLHLFLKYWLFKSKAKFRLFSFEGNFTSVSDMDELTKERYERFRGGRSPVFYTEALQAAHHIHVPAHDSHRILQHHYAFAFFQDRNMQSFYRRFVRDYMRYKGTIRRMILVFLSYCFCSSLHLCCFSFSPLSYLPFLFYNEQS